MNSAPIKPLISTSDLDKIDVRIGTILAVEDVAHSETLVCRFRQPRALHSRQHEKVAAARSGRSIVTHSANLKITSRLRRTQSCAQCSDTRSKDPEKQQPNQSV